MERWKGIKSLISLKTVASSVRTVLSLENGDTIVNPYDIARFDKIFINYFASIAETTKKALNICITILGMKMVGSTIFL